MIARVFVCKRPGFDVEAKALQTELTEQLRVADDIRLRIYNRYDILLPGETGLQSLITGVFSETNQDIVFTSVFPLEPDDDCFAVEYLPGVYDARADAAEQCVRLLEPGCEPRVKTAKVYCFSHPDGSLKWRMLGYLLNPVDSRAADPFGDADFPPLDAPRKPVERIRGFSSMGREDLGNLASELSLSITADDLEMVRERFAKEGRDSASVTELRVLDAYWSDHCRHTTFNTPLTSVSFAEGGLNGRIRASYAKYLLAAGRIPGWDGPATLMRIATSPARLAKMDGRLGDLDESDEVNACAYKTTASIDGSPVPYLIQFKNETHNHPTEIEPFGGAATCLGGAIRDPMSGRAYVHQSMRVTGGGDPRAPLSRTLPGKLPQRRIATQAARGFSSYGNQIGLCTGQVKEYYHPGFIAKRMEIGAVIAASPASNVRRASLEPGDLIYLVGGRTGRDGIGGASGSSKAHDSGSVTRSGGEVQKGNPLQERKLQRLFRNPEFCALVKKCNDFGAGGVSVAMGEMAPGVRIDLSSMLVKQQGLDSTELAISESQERMAVAISPKDEEKFTSLVRTENLECSRTGAVTARPSLVMDWEGAVAADIPRDLIDSNGAPRTARASVDFPSSGEAACPASLGDALSLAAQNLNLAGHRGLTEMFDNTIGAGTVLYPYGGSLTATEGDVMASLLPASGECSTASLMSHAYDPYLAQENPWLAALCAVTDATAKLACAGAGPDRVKLSLQEYFAKPGDDPARWGAALAAVLGAFEAQTGLGVSAVGGKDSMSGSYEDLSVPPTLVAFAVSDLDAGSVRANVLSPGWKVWLLSPGLDSDGVPVLSRASEMYGRLAGAAGVAAAGACPAVTTPLSALANMLAGEGAGFTFEPGLDPGIVFSRSPGACLAGADDIAGTGLEEFATLLGECTEDGVIRFASERVSLSSHLEEREALLSGVYPVLAPGPASGAGLSFSAPAIPQATRDRFGAPRVAVPVFPGTNCEYDTVRAFEKAGAVCGVSVFLNTRPGDAQESAAALARLIGSSQILALPGGFSAADEPDGSAKFIVSVLKSPLVREAVTGLLDRGGLIIGICNGFQALIKTGLVPYGRIADLEVNSPTLTFNSIGRHVARLVRTRVSSTLSPWLSRCAAGEVHLVAVSHGEGRFWADPATLSALADRGQIALQYCDARGGTTGASNPNGSLLNTEALTSPDGRVLGKMGHSERTGGHFCKNVPGLHEDMIFSAGVDYFR